MINKLLNSKMNVGDKFDISKNNLIDFTFETINYLNERYEKIDAKLTFWGLKNKSAPQEPIYFMV